MRRVRTRARALLQQRPRLSTDAAPASSRLRSRAHATRPPTAYTHQIETKFSSNIANCAPLEERRARANCERENVAKNATLFDVEQPESPPTSLATSLRFGEKLRHRKINNRSDSTRLTTRSLARPPHRPFVEEKFAEACVYTFFDIFIYNFQSLNCQSLFKRLQISKSLKLLQYSNARDDSADAFNAQRARAQQIRPVSNQKLRKFSSFPLLAKTMRPTDCRHVLCAKNCVPRAPFLRF